MVLSVTVKAQGKFFVGQNRIDVHVSEYGYEIFDVVNIVCFLYMFESNDEVWQQLSVYLVNSLKVNDIFAK